MGFFSGFASGFGENIKGAGAAYANAQWQARRRAEDRADKIEDEARRTELGLAQKGVNINDLKTGKPLSSGNLTPTELMAEYTQRTATHYEPANVATRKMYADRQEAETAAENLGYTPRNTGEEVIDPWTGKKVERVNTAAKEMQEDLRTKREDERAILSQKRISSSAEQASLKKDYDDAQSDTYGIIDAVIITQDDDGNDIYQKGKGYNLYITAKKENVKRNNEIADLRLKTALQKYEDDKGDKADALKGFYARTLVGIQDFASKGKAISQPEDFKRKKDKFGNFYHIMMTAKQLMDDINEGTVSGDSIVKRVSALDKLWTDFQFNQRQSTGVVQMNAQWRAGSPIYDGAIYPNLLEDSEEPKGLYDENKNIVPMSDDEITNRSDITLSFLKDYEESIIRELDLLVKQREQAINQGGNPKAIASIDSASEPLINTVEVIRARKKALNSSAGMFDYNR